MGLWASFTLYLTKILLLLLLLLLFGLNVLGYFKKQKQPWINYFEKLLEVVRKKNKTLILN
jgi:hypothetical protein